MRRVLLVAVLAALLVAPLARAWTWPTDGPVLQPFSFDPNQPYAAGQHRGIDLAGDPGAAVRAPAAGTVTFAGTVPSSGKSVTITTADGYAVTLTHLGSIAVPKNAAVAEGDPVGTVAATGDADVAQPYVHLGVRVASEPEGYVDPLSFLPARAAAPATLVSPTPAPAPIDPAPAVSDPAPVVDSAPVAGPAAAPDPAPVVATALAAPAADSAPSAPPADPAPPARAAGPAAAVVVVAPPATVVRLPAPAPAPEEAETAAATVPHIAVAAVAAQHPLAAAPSLVHRDVVVPRPHPQPAAGVVATRGARRAPVRPRPVRRLRPHDLALGSRSGATVRRAPLPPLRHDGRRGWTVLVAVAAVAVAVAVARKARRRAVPTMDGHALLRHDADLLRQRPPAHRSRLHDDRGRHPRAPAQAARRGDVLPHGRRRARDEGVACR